MHLVTKNTAEKARRYGLALPIGTFPYSICASETFTGTAPFLPFRSSIRSRVYVHYTFSQLGCFLEQIEGAVIIEQFNCELGRGILWGSALWTEVQSLSFWTSGGGYLLLTRDMSCRSFLSVGGRGKVEHYLCFVFLREVCDGLADPCGL